MNKSIDKISLFMENNVEYTLQGEQLGNFSVEGIKSSIRRLRENFEEFVECEHFTIEIKKDVLPEIKKFLSNGIVAVGVGKKLIYLPYQQDVDDSALNCFQENIISKNGLIYILVSIVKNFEDCYNLEMINDPGYEKYMFGEN